MFVVLDTEKPCPYSHNGDTGNIVDVHPPDIIGSIERVDVEEIFHGR
jgi:hypothetical protein